MAIELQVEADPHFPRRNLVQQETTRHRTLVFQLFLYGGYRNLCPTQKVWYEEKKYKSNILFQLAFKRAQRMWKLGMCGAPVTQRLELGARSKNYVSIFSKVSHLNSFVSFIFSLNFGALQINQQAWDRGKTWKGVTYKKEQHLLTLTERYASR